MLRVSQGSKGPLLQNLMSVLWGIKWSKAERSGKGKANACPLHMDDVVQKLAEIQSTIEGRSEMLETQKRVSNEKLESARFNHLAAMQHAKSTILETYQTLIAKETTGMPDDVKAEHMMALKCLRESLFPNSH
uniref:Uncharacterized protein n=1 Tax=Arundo donax TaxID=35708 RepID=A0A0A8ZZ75_ARUDO